MSEMTVARRLKQKRRGEFALIRRAPDEPFFGVQLAGTDPEEMGWAAALVESRGADLVDVNFGCPIDSLHPERDGRGPRPPAQAHPAHRRGHEARGRRRSRHREDPPRLERRRSQLPGAGPGRRRRRRRRDHRARAHARCPVSPVGRLGRDWRSGGRRAGAGRGQRRHPVPAPHQRGPRPVGMRRRDGRPRRRSSSRGCSARPSGATRTSRRTIAWRSTAATSISPASTGARTSTA